MPLVFAVPLRAAGFPNSTATTKPCQVLLPSAPTAFTVSIHNLTTMHRHAQPCSVAVNASHGRGMGAWKQGRSSPSHNRLLHEKGPYDVLLAGAVTAVHRDKAQPASLQGCATLRH